MGKSPSHPSTGLTSRAFATAAARTQPTRGPNRHFPASRFNKMLSKVILTVAASCVASVSANVFDYNPRVADADITIEGSDFLWAIFAVMLASAIGVTTWTLMTPPGKRTFHVLSMAILFTASTAYFAMASNLGATAVYVEFVRYKSDLFTDTSINPYTRSIWYARYIDWFITTPLLLTELLLSTGMPLSGIAATIFFDIVMVVGGLIGALVPSVYKWGFFAGSTVAMLAVFYSLMVPARANAKALGDQVYKSYWTSALVLAGLWLLYPVAWGLCDGGNVIPPDSEMVFYGVLDFLAKPCFLIFHLWGMRKIDYSVFQLQSGHFSAYADVRSGVIPHTGDHGVASGLNGGKAALGHNTPAAGNAHGAPGTGTNPGQVHIAGRRSDATAV